jgi:hypothetical protein
MDLITLVFDNLPTIISLTLALCLIGFVFILIGIITPFSKSSGMLLGCTNLTGGVVAFSLLIPVLMMNLFVNDGCDYLRVDKLSMISNGYLPTYLQI